MRIALIGPGQPFRGGIAQHADLLVKALGLAHEVTHLGFRRQYPRWLFGGRSDRDPSAPTREGRAERILDPFNPLSWWRTARHLAALERVRAKCGELLRTMDQWEKVTLAADFPEA